MSKTVVLRLGANISLPFSRRFLVALPLLVAALLVSMFAALNMGAMQTQLGDVWAALTTPADQWSDEARSVALFRLPRILAAVLAGAMLAVSGYLLQVVSRNGLADPGILGLSDGATVAVMVTSFLMPAVAVGALGGVALVGALGVALLVLGLGRRMLQSGGIILVGLSVNIVLGAVVEVILVSGSAMQFSRLLVWSRGTLASVDAGDLRFMAIWCAAMIPCVLLVSRWLAPLLLGPQTAESLGLRVGPAYALFVVLAAAAAAPVVATCGPVAFVGLMSSYIARGLVGDRPGEVLVTAMLAGGLILLWADTLGRTLFSPIIVSAGIMVSVVGVLSFILAARLGQRRSARQE
ncbi:ferrichrome transport system permease protein FhuG [Ketogulonicigenium robustum]|uniref:Ferrichrome transport system permease protein FhuG n=1 Tax=Ketogulonicigenium robustum TaxID=92947 RepID=A0A1W6NZD9_9RHOB|nr:iron ABC transporter permease [Ketogulonicigenium robustum]ARO14615.1 ferrichrome transport system permease protein FhuG [Ketogulonicigenium robustum]